MSISAYCGVLAFTLNEIREKFPSFSEVAIKSALRRISENGAVMPVRKGFYAIIPLGYALRGVLPLVDSAFQR